MDKYILLKILKCIFNKLGIFSGLRCQFNRDYHRCVFNKLKPYLYEAYKNTLFNYRKDDYQIDTLPKFIWIFWWQGIGDAPLIVKKCINSIIHNSNNHKVILITKYNINKYVSFPRFIQEKLKRHYITLTHLSDILRFKLLYKYGGLWIDSTIFCTSNIKTYGIKKIYTSGGYDNLYNIFVSAKWTGFLIGGRKQLPIFYFMNRFFKLYWEDNNKLIDYFLIDYGLEFAYKMNISGFRKYVDNRADQNNPHLHALLPLLNKKYNKKIYDKITSDTNMFKLTYKKKFYYNIDSFYNRIINNKL